MKLLTFAIIAAPALALLVGCMSLQGPRIEPVSTARAQPAGTRVTVEGVVSVASGALDEGFAVQDARTAVRRVEQYLPDLVQV